MIEVFTPAELHDYKCERRSDEKVKGGDPISPCCASAVRPANSTVSNQRSAAHESAKELQLRWPSPPRGRRFFLLAYGPI